MRAHTPLPWEVVVRCDRYYDILASEGGPSFPVANLSACSEPSERKANAALICKAVNHHDELVAALRDAVRLMPLGAKVRAEWLGRASDALKKIDTP
jgi:hypothetical protein